MRWLTTDTLHGWRAGSSSVWFTLLSCLHTSRCAAARSRARSTHPASMSARPALPHSTLGWLATWPRCDAVYCRQGSRPPLTVASYEGVVKVCQPALRGCNAALAWLAFGLQRPCHARTTKPGWVDGPFGDRKLDQQSGEQHPGAWFSILCDVLCRSTEPRPPGSSSSSTTRGTRHGTASRPMTAPVRRWSRCLICMKPTSSTMVSSCACFTLPTECLFQNNH